MTYRDLLGAALRWQTPPEGDQPRAAVLPASLTPGTVATVLGLFASRTPLVALDPAMPANREQKISSILVEHGYQPWPVQVADAPPGGADLDGELGADADIDDVTSIQFTSGSTGTPKAVLHPNGLWLADAQLLNHRFGLGDGRRVALCMPISFAAGLNVLIAALLGGAEVIAVDPRRIPRVRHSIALPIGAHRRSPAHRRSSTHCTPRREEPPCPRWSASSPPARRHTPATYGWRANSPPRGVHELGGFDRDAGHREL